MNEKWIVWILASIFQHFKGLNETFIIPTQEMPATLSTDRFELMFTGPDFNRHTSDNTDITITLNLLCISNQVPTNPYRQYQWIGKGLMKFDTCIPIHNYATDELADEVIGSLNLATDIKVTDIRPFDVVSRQQRGTIEATYSISLEP